VGTENLITEGFSLMLLGMGTVFVFLTLLVVVTTGMSSVVQKYLPEPVPTTPKGTSRASQQDQQTLLAVISAAIHAHRSNKK
tara:strand:- start:2194 stop:2439 length:246 start_codon:yes stop_codon:yes gene_type:complete